MARNTRTLEKTGSTTRRSANGRGRIVSKEPIHEQILPHIRRDIVHNRWAPGERLPEMELCEEFGVSRTPLRDVLKILEVEGLIQLVPHIGAIVTPLNPPDLSEKLEVMSGLEQIAAMTVARRRPPQAIKEIERLHRAMAQAATDGQISKYYALNDEFHRAIVLGAANHTLSKIHETVMWHVSRARNRANERETLTPRAAEHHDAIVDRILKGDQEGAARAMREHLDDVIANVLARMNRGTSPETSTDVQPDAA